MKKILSLLFVFLNTLLLSVNAQAVPPLGTTIESWYLSFTLYYFDGDGKEQSMSDTEQMKIAIDGSDVYFNFANPINGNYWIKGTMNGNVVTFPKDTKIGQYQGADIYVNGDNGSAICDAVFNYDSAKETFTLGDMNLLINTSPTTNSSYFYFSKYTVSKYEEKKAETVTPPAGLLTAEYVFTGSSVTRDNDGFNMQSFSRNVRIGTLGQEVYIQGIYEYLPTAWIKGNRDADGNITFVSGQYLGKDFYDIYFAAARYPTSNPEWRNDITFYYDSSSKSYTSSDLILVNTKADDLSPVEMYANAKFTKINNVAATPKAPSVKNFIPYNKYQDGSYGLIMLDVPTVSTTGEAILSSKLYYKVYFGSETPYVFKPETYTALTSEMTEIPYSFSDGQDFFMAGSAVFFFEDVKDVERIGVQSVYKGGSETHESAITWFDVNEFLTGIEGTNVSEPTVVSEQLYNLNGSAVSNNTKGILLKTMRMSDGTQKTVKVINK